jgi:hypothetical protein
MVAPEVRILRIQIPKNFRRTTRKAHMRPWYLSADGARSPISRDKRRTHESWASPCNSMVYSSSPSSKRRGEALGPAGPPGAGVRSPA